jgi:hypothetical protein
MAQGRKNEPPKEYRFKKGQSGNPSGKPKEDPRLKMLKNLTKTELVEIGNLVVKGNLTELRAIAKDESCPVIKAMIASIAVKIISKGDVHALDILLNRLIGKVKDEVEHTGRLDMPIVQITMPSNGREKK